jgi:hypothetical protein
MPQVLGKMTVDIFIDDVFSFIGLQHDRHSVQMQRA